MIIYIERTRATSNFIIGSLQVFDVEYIDKHKGEENKDFLFGCVTLELPFKNNERKISCIPNGNYIVKPYISNNLGNCLYINEIKPEEKTNFYKKERTYTERYEMLKKYKIENKSVFQEVTGRTAILIHRGNTVANVTKKDTKQVYKKESDGCILVGRTAAEFDSVSNENHARLIESRVKMDRLYNIIKNIGICELLIRGETNG